MIGGVILEKSNILSSKKDILILKENFMDMKRAKYNRKHWFEMILRVKIFFTRNERW